MSHSDATGVIATGRPLDRRGEPRAGPTLSLDPESPATAALRSAPRPLASSPSAGVWACLLERPDEGVSDRPVLLQWLAPDATAPPTHVHPASERFAVLDGKLTVVEAGEVRALAAGEEVTVEAGVAHSFRNDGDDLVAFRAELPSMRTVRALFTLWGLDHDAGRAEGDYDAPGPFQAFPIAADAYPDTVATAAPVPLQRALWATLGRVARALGNDGIDDRYLQDEFWDRSVEQPAFDRRG